VNSRRWGTDRRGGEAEGEGEGEARFFQKSGVNTFDERVSMPATGLYSFFLFSWSPLATGRICDHG